jgi:hypothetical protein
MHLFRVKNQYLFLFLVFNSNLNLCHAVVPHVSFPGFCSNKLLFRPLFRNVGERWMQFLISETPELFSGIVSFSGSAFGLISVNIPEYSLFQKPTLKTSFHLLVSISRNPFPDPLQESIFRKPFPLLGCGYKCLFIYKSCWCEYQEHSGNPI